jgi:hypothetical protein
MTWGEYLRRAWPLFLKGQRVNVPQELRSTVRTLRVPRVAKNVGQSGNYVLPCTDGSRIHVHEYADGRLVAHRDRTDPGRSPLHAVWHLLTD